MLQGYIEKSIHLAWFPFGFLPMPAITLSLSHSLALPLPRPNWPPPLATQSSVYLTRFLHCFPCRTSNKIRNHIRIWNCVLLLSKLHFSPCAVFLIRSSIFFYVSVHLLELYVVTSVIYYDNSIKIDKEQSKWSVNGSEQLYSIANRNSSHCYMKLSSSIISRTSIYIVLKAKVVVVVVSVIFKIWNATIREGSISWPSRIYRDDLIQCDSIFKIGIYGVNVNGKKPN